MTYRVITVSYTPLDAPGGVPRWNRDLHSAFPDRECLHYSWWDHPASQDATGCNFLSEPDKAKVLNQYLLQKRLVTPDDVIVADGFWLSGLEHLPFAVSVCHGIWGHITKDDRDAGKQPENAFLHAAQVAYRQKLWEIGGSMVSVSDFIADEMEKQWGWKVPVINTGFSIPEEISIEEKEQKRNSDKFREFSFGEDVFVHGINDSKNMNKGFDHIKAVQKKFSGKVLDEWNSEIEWPTKKTLQLMHYAVVPSAFEGNSYFVGELLSCGVPIVAYNVGLLYKTKKDGDDLIVGELMDRRERSPDRTVAGVCRLRERIEANDKLLDPRGYIRRFSIEQFRIEWRTFINSLI